MKQKSKYIFCHICTDQSGFSLVELMVILVLLAIVTALALPSYTHMIEKRRLSHDAEEIVAFIHLAQSESIKRNEVMTVSYVRNSDNNWCIGSVLGPTACDCAVTDTLSTEYCTVDAKPRLISGQNPGYTSRIRSASGDGAFSFDPVRGMLLSKDDFLILDLRSDSEAFRLQLSVSNTGLTQLCSHDSAHRLPGYAICP